MEKFVLKPFAFVRMNEKTSQKFIKTIKFILNIYNVRKHLAIVHLDAWI